MPNSLQPADLRILTALQRDGRLTNQALAGEVGLSTSPCWRRVRQFEEGGVIQGCFIVGVERLIYLMRIVGKDAGVTV